MIVDKEGGRWSTWRLNFKFKIKEVTEGGRLSRGWLKFPANRRDRREGGRESGGKETSDNKRCLREGGRWSIGRARVCDGMKVREERARGRWSMG